MTEKQIEQFRQVWGTWFDDLKPLIDNGTLAKVYSDLKSQGARMDMCPNYMDTYKAFELCKRDELKCVLVGLAPYASYTREGKPIADGLAFSCSKIGKEQPSLKLLWNAIEDDLGQSVKRFTDLSFLAHQGVLLMNIALTAKKDKPDSHVELWKGFMEYFFSCVLEKDIGLPIVFMGEVAWRYASFVMPFGPRIMKVEHPARAAREDREFQHKGMFTWINKMLDEDGKETILWNPRQEEYDEILENAKCPF